MKLETEEDYALARKIYDTISPFLHEKEIDGIRGRFIYDTQVNAVITYIVFALKDRKN